MYSVKTLPELRAMAFCMWLNWHTDDFKVNMEVSMANQHKFKLLLHKINQLYVIDCHTEFEYNAPSCFF